MRPTLDGMIRALILIRFGQELGTDSKAARMVHDVVDLFAAIVPSLFG